MFQSLLGKKINQNIENASRKLPKRSGKRMENGQEIVGGKVWGKMWGNIQENVGKGYGKGW